MGSNSAVGAVALEPALQARVALTERHGQPVVADPVAGAAVEERVGHQLDVVVAVGAGADQLGVTPQVVGDRGQMGLGVPDDAVMVIAEPSRPPIGTSATDSSH